MGITGTDVAKGAADIILQDDSFTTIEKAIKEGRKIYNNIKKSVIFAISSNISEILVMFASIACGLSAPFKAAQILWVNLLTDSLPCFALGVDEDSTSNVMNEKPRKKTDTIFSGGGTRLVAIYSILITIITLGAYLFLPIKYVMDNNLQLSISTLAGALAMDDIFLKSSTYAFCILALSQVFHAIGMRNTKVSIFKNKPFSNRVMILAVAAGIIGQILVTEVPFLAAMFGVAQLSMMEWGVLIVVAMLPMLVHEILLLFKS